MSPTSTASRFEPTVSARSTGWLRSQSKLPHGMWKDRPTRTLTYYAVFFETPAAIVWKSVTENVKWVLGTYSTFAPQAVSIVKLLISTVIVSVSTREEKIRYK